MLPTGSVKRFPGLDEIRFTKFSVNEYSRRRNALYVIFVQTIFDEFVFFSLESVKKKLSYLQPPTKH